MRLLTESCVFFHHFVGGETAGGSDQPNKGPEVGRAAGCIPFLGGGPESPPGTVGCSILVQTPS